MNFSGETIQCGEWDIQNRPSACSALIRNATRTNRNGHCCLSNRFMNSTFFHPPFSRLDSVKLSANGKKWKKNHPKFTQFIIEWPHSFHKLNNSNITKAQMAILLFHNWCDRRAKTGEKNEPKKPTDQFADRSRQTKCQTFPKMQIELKPNKKRSIIFALFQIISNSANSKKKKLVDEKNEKKKTVSLFVRPGIERLNQLFCRFEAKLTRK